LLGENLQNTKVLIHEDVFYLHLANQPPSLSQWHIPHAVRSIIFHRLLNNRSECNGVAFTIMVDVRSLDFDEFNEHISTRPQKKRVLGQPKHAKIQPLHMATKCCVNLDLLFNMHQNILRCIN